MEVFDVAASFDVECNVEDVCEFPASFTWSLTLILSSGKRSMVLTAPPENPDTPGFQEPSALLSLFAIVVLYLCDNIGVLEQIT